MVNPNRRRSCVEAQHTAPVALLPFLLLVLLVLLVLLGAAPLGARAQSDRYAGLPQTTSLQGFPEVGYPSALVEVKLYAAFDDPASAQFWTGGFERLIQRARNGEIRVIFVPLFGAGETTSGRGAARAALCAGEQGSFWAFADQAFAWQTQFGADAFSGDRLLTGVQALGLDQARWNTCFTGTNPDAVLEAAQQAANNEVSFNQTPYVVVGDSPSLTDAESLDFTINLVLGQANADLATEIAATPEATPVVDTYTYDPLTGDHVAPPLTLDLPASWQYGFDALVLEDIDGIRPIPFALYQGPVTGGTGSIVLLWGFPNLVVGAPAGGLVQPDVWTDGTRLLRLAVFEQGCNVGTDLRRNYSVGGMQAVGTQFAAVDCPQFPDTRGWFAGLRQFNVNFVFYVYTDPITAMDKAQPELQAILDTVRFVAPEATPAATAEPAS